MKRDKGILLILNHCLYLWAVVIFSFTSIQISSQSHKISVRDQNRKPVTSLHILINENENLITNNVGEVNFNGIINMVEINQDGYYFKESDIGQDGLYQIQLSKIKTQQIEEVILIRKDTLINEYKPQRDGRDYNCSYDNNNFAVLTAFTKNKRFSLLNYSFYITSNSKFNKAFNFVIYRRVSDQLEKVLSQTIDSYDIKNNTYDLSSKHISLDPGEYFFGMEWIIEEPKINYHRKIHEVMEIYGQSLGGSLNKKNMTETYFFKDGSLRKIDHKVYQQIKLRL